MRYAPLLLAALLLPAGAAAAAQAPQPARSPALSRLVDCRQVTGTAERLACYDREVAALDAAEARKEVVVVDRDQLRKTRRTLFGLVLPNLSVFGDDNEDAEGVSSIETTIKSVSQDPYGKWFFELAEGGRWAQIDSRELGVDARAGQPISIRRAAAGSYLANVNKQVAIRVRRLR